MIAYLSRAPPTSSKKWKVLIIDENSGRKKTISFGSRGYEDFTIHKDEMRRRRYENRHRSRENWNDPFTAGFWSERLLWNKPTIEASIRDINKRFGIIFK